MTFRRSAAVRPDPAWIVLQQQASQIRTQKPERERYEIAVQTSVSHTSIVCEQLGPDDFISTRLVSLACSANEGGVLESNGRYRCNRTEQHKNVVEAQFQLKKQKIIRFVAKPIRQYLVLDILVAHSTSKTANGTAL